MLPGHFFARIEDIGHVDGRLGDRRCQLEHHRQAGLHVRRSQTPEECRRRCGASSLSFGGTVSRCPADDQPARPAEGRCGRRRCAPPGRPRARARPATGARRDRRWPLRRGSPREWPTKAPVAASRSVTGHGPMRASGSRRDPSSRSNSFSLALSWRWPGSRWRMIRMHGSPNSPPGELAGPRRHHADAPRRHDAPGDFGPGLGVDDGNRRG